ncbi:MAG: hypothetical protein ACKO3I_01780 [Synechococcales cyanobacterium]
MSHQVLHRYSHWYAQNLGQQQHHEVKIYNNHGGGLTPGMQI